MKKIENDTEEGKDILYSWIGRINVVNMAMLPKAIYRFDALLSIKILMAFFKEPEINNLKFTWNHRRPQIAKAILRKRSWRYY